MYDSAHSFTQQWYRQSEVASGNFTRMKNSEFLIKEIYYLCNNTHRGYQKLQITAIMVWQLTMASISYHPINTLTAYKT
jgi:hypothetical protein